MPLGAVSVGEPWLERRKIMNIIIMIIMI